MISSMRRQLQDGNVDEGVYNTIPPIFWQHGRDITAQEI